MRTVLGPRALRTSVIAAVLAGLGGGGLVVAPSASAARICQTDIRNHWRWVDNLADATVRSGPGTAHSARYQLYYGDSFLAVCKTKNSYGNTWFYGKDIRDRKGWISADRTIAE
ncbi:SH3 domain-containing protein [Streptomyces sp. NPDC058595]|uniref:SH3 domain-containing protein n=1 Tax=Streptomyces sp. NPDC058595 TaxID=3346550 RepID=UPI0036537D20